MIRHGAAKIHGHSGMGRNRPHQRVASHSQMQATARIVASPLRQPIVQLASSVLHGGAQLRPRRQIVVRDGSSVLQGGARLRIPNCEVHEYDNCWDGEFADDFGRCGAKA